MDEVTNVVIGGGSGMGKAVAERLASRGKLIVADKDFDAARSVASELNATPFVCDLLDQRSLHELVSKVGNLGALIITAGLSPSMSDGFKIFDVNLRGTALAIDAFESALSPGSVAVCFASIAGHLMQPSDPRIHALLDNPLSPTVAQDLIEAGIDIKNPGIAYSISKYGVIRLCRRKSADWGEIGSRIISLSPGMVSTPMGELEFKNQPFKYEILKKTPLKRVGNSSEIASVADFLSSSGASFVTGIDVLVDGGFMASNAL